jgi:hypothetical protein
MKNATNALETLPRVEPGSLAQEPLAPPSAVELTQPVAVYLQWTLLGSLAIALALLESFDRALARLAQAFPEWSQLAGAASLAALLLAGIERCKRDRARVGLALLGGAALGVGWMLELAPIGPANPRAAWFAVLACAGYGALHLLLLEDWIAGRSGPGFRSFAGALRDMASWRWWFWCSKAASLQRVREQAALSEVRVRQAQDEAVRRGAEQSLAACEAERRTAEQRSAAAAAVAQAAQAERKAALEQQSAADALRELRASEALRVEAEARLAAARKESEELGRLAEDAALDRARLRKQRLEAERHVLQAALAAAESARQAAALDVEAERASALLQLAEAELRRANQPLERD